MSAMGQQDRKSLRLVTRQSRVANMLTVNIVYNSRVVEERTFSNAVRISKSSL
jgi:hypothetical protein